MRTTLRFSLSAALAALTLAGGLSTAHALSCEVFFCVGDDISLIGKVAGSKLTGQGFKAGGLTGLRSAITCRADDTCQ